MNGLMQSIDDDIVSQHETVQTKQLTDEQLKRFVLLKYSKLIDLQIKKLERDLETEPTINNVNFELIGFNGLNPADLVEFYRDS